MSISVIDFGAKGDQATDNSPVLQALIDSLPDSEEMKTIYFPSGLYGLGSTLKVNKSNLIFDGPGILYSLGTGTANRSLLQFNTYTGTDLTTHRFQNIIVRNIGFDMRVAYTRDPIIWDPEWDIDYGMEVGALSFMGIDNVTLENVRISKTVHSGLNVFGCYNVRIDNVTVDMLKSYTLPGGVIRGGNAINLCTYGWGSSGSITNGRIGNYRISHCHIYGSEDWLPAIGTNDVTDQCNIGIMIETGSANYLEHQIEPVIVSGCTVERCYWGIIAEGMKQGGSGDVLVTNNAIKECFTGAGLYPDMTGELGHNSFNFIFTHNKISQIYTYALDCKGENILIGNNIIRDWGLLKKTDPGSSLQNTTACAIIVEPKYPGNNTTGVFHNLKIYDNIFEISAPHDDTYASGVGGIWIDNRADTNTTFRDVIISDNILNGGKSTYSSGIRESGIFIWGAVQNIAIHHNTITGFPRQAILAIPFETNGVARAVSQMRITENVMYDLCWGPGVNEAAMTIVSGNTDFEFSDNKVFQIEGSNLTMILSIPQINNADSPLNYLTIRNNTARNLKYGDTVVFSLKISGSSVIIENNSGWNYGVAAPSDTSQYRFKGELVHNTNPNELGSSGAKYVVSGWKCIAKGKPGSWVQQRILTGN